MSTHGALLRTLRLLGRRVGGTVTIVDSAGRCCNSSSKRCIHCCALMSIVGKVRTHSAKRTSLARRLTHRLNSSTAPRIVPFISMSVIMRPEAARCCCVADFPSVLARRTYILSTHFRVSSLPLFWRFPMYPPKYPLVWDCAVCVRRTIRRKAFLRFALVPGTQCRAQCASSCVSRIMGSRSLSFTSEFPPEKATHIPGAVPSNQGLFRWFSTQPCMVRVPVIFKPLSLAMPLHTRSGAPSFTLLSRGKSCLHVFAHRKD